MRKYKLKDLLDKITPENLPDDFWGIPICREGGGYTSFFFTR